MPTSRLPMWVVVIVTLLVYAPVLTNDFVSWDDSDTIYNNARLNPASIEKTAWYWAHPENGEYLPLTRTVWAALSPLARLTRPDERGGTLNPWIYHGVSVLVHSLSSLLVYLILARILWIRQRFEHARDASPTVDGKRCLRSEDTLRSRPAVASRRETRGRDVELAPSQAWLAAAGALLFAIHPLQVEPVAWASGLKDLLFGLFALAAILAYLCYANDAQRPEPQAIKPGRTGGDCQDLRYRGLFYALGMLALLASILSKPMGVITSLPVALLGWRLCRRPFRQVMLELAPWFGLSLVFGLLARHWMPATAIPTVGLWQRPLVAADSLAFYAFKLVWPVDLAIDYGRTPLVAMSSGWGWFTWLVPATIGALLWRTRRSRPLVGLGAAVFVLAALPILGLSPHMFQYYSTVADHYIYLPMLGVAIAATYGLSLLRARTAVVVAGLSLALLAIRTILQTTNWTDDPTFWRHTLGVNPRSYISMVALGRQDVGHDWDKSLLSQALKLNPDYLPTHQALVAYYTAHRQIDPAIAHLQRGLEITETYPESLRPDLAPQYLSLAELLLARGRPTDALAAAKRARQLSPANPANPAIPGILERIRVASTTQPTTAPTTAPVLPVP